MSYMQAILMRDALRDLSEMSPASNGPTAFDADESAILKTASELSPDAAVAFLSRVLLEGFGSKAASAAVSELDDVIALLRPGFEEKCAERGIDPDRLIKSAGPIMDTMGETIDKNISNPWLSTATDIGSYFVPGVGTARFGYDAVANAANAFAPGLGWKQRLGYAGSSLADALFAGSSLFGLGWLSPIFRGAASAGKFGRIGKALGKYFSKSTGWQKALAPKALKPMKGVGGIGKSIGNTASNVGSLLNPVNLGKRMMTSPEAAGTGLLFGLPMIGADTEAPVRTTIGGIGAANIGRYGLPENLRQFGNRYARPLRQRATY